ncbi:MAG: outer membrane protein assembly factor BamD [Paracoccaceae bacterium]
MTRAGARGARTASVTVRAAACALALGALAACGPGTSRNVNLDGATAEQIFERGEFELAQGNPEDAAFFFGEVERLYPYAAIGGRALIMRAFAHHRDRDYENARASAQLFLDAFPDDEDAAYAQYLLALSYYDQIDEVGRDQGLAFQSLRAFQRLIEDYPDSEYVESSILKFDLAFDHLAAKEMEIGRYYLKRDHFAASVRRFRVVVEDFQTTSHTPEALHRLVEAYLSLGLTAEAQTAGAILGHNYQATQWYEDSFALLTGQGLQPVSVGDNWLSAIYRQVIVGEWL